MAAMARHESTDRSLKFHGFAVVLTVLRAISQSHDEAQKSHGKQIHRPQNLKKKRKNKLNSGSCSQMTLS